METDKQETFYPTFVFKEAVVALGVFIVIILLAVFLPAGMGDPADPSDSAFIPKPEWYFLPAYQFLKVFPGKLEILGIILQPLILLGLCALPFIDRNPERRMRKRKVQLTLLVVIVAITIILGVLGHLA
jgi:quinol-cytochrome oxidoreductase complex cytochrome b subunit